jgi:hypothetical protein
MTADSETETELQSDDYVATAEELQIIDAAMVSINAGESVSAPEIKKIFVKYRRR